MTLKTVKLFCLLCCVLGLFIACQNDQSTSETNRDQLKPQNMHSVTESDHHINQEVRQKFNEINELTTLIYNDELLMAIDVNQLAQFNEQKIAKDIESYISTIDPKMNATVSSDYKIFLEINRLKQKITTENLNSTDVDKQFQSIKKLTETPGG